MHRRFTELNFYLSEHQVQLWLFSLPRRPTNLFNISIPLRADWYEVYSRRKDATHNEIPTNEQKREWLGPKY